MTGLTELIDLRKELDELNETPLEDQEIEIEVGKRKPNPFFDINQ